MFIYRLFYPLLIALCGQLVNASKKLATNSKYNAVTLILTKAYCIIFNVAYLIRFGDSENNPHMVMRINNDISAKEALMQ